MNTGRATDEQRTNRTPDVRSPRGADGTGRTGRLGAHLHRHRGVPRIPPTSLRRTGAGAPVLGSRGLRPPHVLVVTQCAVTPRYDGWHGVICLRNVSIARLTRASKWDDSPQCSGPLDAGVLQVVTACNYCVIDECPIRRPEGLTPHRIDYAGKGIDPPSVTTTQFRICGSMSHVPCAETPTPVSSANLSATLPPGARFPYKTDARVSRGGLPLGASRRGADGSRDVGGAPGASWGDWRAP
jgi:hypothetical protein